MTETTLTPSSESEENLDAAERLAATVRDGQWAVDAVWLEFVALRHAPGDYRRLRQLWLDVPRRCRNRYVPMAVVARAALLEAEHTEARLLLRKAIVSLSKRNRRLRVRLRRLLTFKKPPVPAVATHAANDTETGARTTLIYFGLYNALATRDRTLRDRSLAELSKLGEGEWLKRV
ncbi:MAG: hypothetical protein ACRD0P_24575 [Stackebrandtia sp.]